MRAAHWQHIDTCPGSGTSRQGGTPWAQGVPFPERDAAEAVGLPLALFGAHPQVQTEMRRHLTGKTRRNPHVTSRHCKQNAPVHIAQPTRASRLALVLEEIEATRHRTQQKSTTHTIAVLDLTIYDCVYLSEQLPQFFSPLYFCTLSFSSFQILATSSFFF